jgi:Trk K+ transport system NAD-binding subunit
MLRAGADGCTSPYESVGVLLATSAVDPSVLGLQDLPTLGLRTEEIAVHATSSAVGRSLRSLAADHPGVLLLGLRDGGGEPAWQSVDGYLQADDVVLALGAPHALKDLTGELSASP